MEFRKSLIAGIGINDSPVPVTVKENGVQAWVCPKYDRWKHLLNFAKKKGRKVNPEFIRLSGFLEHCESFTDHENKSAFDLSGFVDGIISKQTVTMIRNDLAIRMRPLGRNKKKGMMFARLHHSGKSYFAMYTNLEGKRIRKGGFRTELDAHIHSVKVNKDIIVHLLETEDEQTKKAFQPILDDMQYCIDNGKEWNKAGETK